EKLAGRFDEVTAWLKRERASVQLPVYASFDLRDSGVKASIVDSNLFPAGFNNLTAEAMQEASRQVAAYLPGISESKNVLIIPEAHTRNVYYLANLCALKRMLMKAGYNVTLGTTLDDADDVIVLRDACDHDLVLERMRNEHGRLVTASFSDGIILLNNDFSVGAPDLLSKLTDPIIPLPVLGWAHRRKYNHFKHLCSLINRFSADFDLDPWLLCTLIAEVPDIDFGTGKRVEDVASAVDRMLSQLCKKHQQYGITEDPYVFIKDNSGTYGMGILTVKSGREVLDLNSKARRSMRFGKQRSAITSVIIQEGISTKHRVDGAAAEPVLYAVGGQVVGGFMRLHDEKDPMTSLNSPGAKFDILLKDNITAPIIDIDQKELSIYRVLADLAMIAVGQETADALAGVKAGEHAGHILQDPPDNLPAKSGVKSQGGERS
ncbi:glutamate--cysteine ligase, partial [Candidatus Woesearchaeota archaeon CG1_02_57_44]